MSRRTVRTHGGYSNNYYGNSRSGFTANDYKKGSAGMNLIGGFMQANTDVNAAGFDKFTSEQQARLLIRNADARYAQGTRQASEIARQGRKTESDAIAAMIAQGGTVDPTIIAKLNQQSTYNALAAVFQGTQESGSMRLQAQAIKGVGAMNYTNAKASATNSRIKSVSTFMSAFM